MLKRNLIAMQVLMGVMMLTPLTSGNAYELSDPATREVSADQAHYEWMIGWHLASSLIFDYPIFIGTVEEIHWAKSPIQSNGAQAFSSACIRVDEWLYGEPNKWARHIYLEHIPNQGEAGYRSGQAAWENVNMEVGRRLLIVPNNRPVQYENAEPLKAINRYSLVVSSDELFPTIRDTVLDHLRYTQRPNEILDAPGKLDAQTDSIFGGYLTNYFRLREIKDGNESPDAEALVIVRLIGKRRVNWHFVSGGLTRAMTNADSPISDATRHEVTHALMKDGCESDPTLARDALAILVILCDRGIISLGPFLTDQTRQQLCENYLTLMTTETVDKRRAALEAQLGLGSN